MSLTSLTEVVDSCFQALQGIRKEIQEKLLLCGEDKERQKLQYLLQRVEVLGPMSAGGYFEITKSSLISMLSVRYFNHLSNDSILNSSLQFQPHLHHYSGSISIIQWGSCQQNNSATKFYKCNKWITLNIFNINDV